MRTQTNQVILHTHKYHQERRGKAMWQGYRKSIGASILWGGGVKSTQCEGVRIGMKKGCRRDASWERDQCGLICEMGSFMQICMKNRLKIELGYFRN